MNFALQSMRDSLHQLLLQITCIFLLLLIGSLWPLWCCMLVCHWLSWLHIPALLAMLALWTSGRFLWHLLWVVILCLIFNLSSNWVFKHFLMTALVKLRAIHLLGINLLSLGSCKFWLVINVSYKQILLHRFLFVWLHFLSRILYLFLLLKNLRSGLGDSPT